MTVFAHLADDPFAYKRDKKLQERLSAEILQLLKIPGNGACSDCDATRTIENTPP